MVDLHVSSLSASDRETAGAIWHTLETRLQPRGITSTWLWTLTWLETFGDLVPHTFLVATVADQPVGITLVTRGVDQRRGPIPVRSLHIGTEGEPASDAISSGNHRLLVEPTHHFAFSSAIVQRLRTLLFVWDEIVLNAADPDDIPPLLATGGHWHVHRELAPVLDLRPIREAGSDVISALGKTTRRNLRRSMREVGNIDIERAIDPDTATAILGDLIDMHQRRWIDRGEAGAFASERFLAFHTAIVQRFLPLGRIMLFRARTADRTLGCKYGFIEGNAMISYQVGTNDFPGRVNPGLLTNLLCAQYCLEHGLDEFNLMPADLPYKRELSQSTRTLLYAAHTRATPKGIALRLARNRHYGPSVGYTGPDILRPQS